MSSYVEHEMTDEEIVTMALRERAFFGHIVERYQAKLTRYIARLGVRNSDDQDDVLQDIFIKVYKNLNGFDTSLTFSSWIYRIAHNEAISWYRKHNVRPEGHLVGDSEAVLELIQSHEDGSEEIFDKNINTEELLRALDELDPKYRDVLILRFFENKEYEEISDILKIPIGTVGTLVARGKKKLKELLNQEVLNV